MACASGAAACVAANRAIPPDWSLVLLGRRPVAPPPWPSVWVRWPDFAVPVSWRKAREALLTARERAAVERVEIACNGGRGRTGTALACLVTLAGLSAADAVAYVRAHYDRHAVEVPWQRTFITWFQRSHSS